MGDQPPTSAPFDEVTVRARLAEVQRRIEQAGPSGPVEVVAVTKGFGPDAVRATVGSDVVGVGENYAQELLAKAGSPELTAERDVPWHFIGRLQRNKVRQLAPVVAVWQSVDRSSLVDEIARRAPGSRIFVQVNCSDEPQKGGAAWSDVTGLVAHARESDLTVEGLMGVGPDGPPELARPGFIRLVELAETLDLAGRSIGMSHDLEVAVAAGSTMVRVGRALFGPRPVRKT